MPLDTSIPLQVKAPEFNPLQQALQVAQYRYMNANGLAQQQTINANRATSAAYQQATDPTTGQVDNNKLVGILSQNPDAAYNLPQVIQGINTQKQQNLTLSTGQQELANKYSQVGGQIALGVLTNGGSPTDYVQSIKNAVQDGRIDSNVALNWINHAAPTFNDPAAFQGYLKQNLASLPPELQASLSKPVLGEVNTGGGTQFTARNPISGQVAPTGYIANTLSPAEQVARIPTVGPNGQPGTVSQGSIAPSNLLPPGSAPSTGGIGNGRYPTQGAGTAPASAAIPGAPAGFIPTGQTPADAAASTVTGTGSANALLADQQSAAGSGARIYQLQAAQQALQNAGPTGPGTAQKNQIQSFLLAQTPGDLGKYLPGIDPQKIASFDEANKYLTQYASAKASALGSGTDSKLATTLSGNASTHISGLAAQDVVKANIGLERMSQAQQDAWQQSGLPASQYSTWAAKFGSTLDPRVFVADQMDPAKVKTMYDKMQPKEQAQFRAQYNWAVQKGYLNGPQ